jgi:hypothetical protein
MKIAMCNQAQTISRLRHRVHLMKILTALVFATAGGLLLASCTKDVQAMSPSQIEKDYGISGAYSGSVSTPDGPLNGMLVPITLANGGAGHLFIPQRQANDVHAVYIQDERGLHPVKLGESVRRDELARAPGIIATRAVPAGTNKRSWEQEALTVGASAGGGAGIGALAGGRKGAGVGAAAGGVGGLIYDLLTRKK